SDLFDHTKADIVPIALVLRPRIAKTYNQQHASRPGRGDRRIAGCAGSGPYFFLSPAGAPPAADAPAAGSEPSAAGASAAAAGFSSTTSSLALRPAMVAMVKSRSAIVGRMPSGSAMAEIFTESPISSSDTSAT